MTEHIIPITIENSEDPPNHEPSPESDKDESKLSKSLEELSVNQSSITENVNTNNTKSKGNSKPETSRVKVKPAVAISSNDEYEYLKEFDILEKRDANAILSGYSLPYSDIPERIILVIDRAQDENCTPFIIGSQKYNPLGMVKRAINIFIKLKLGINPHHEFAIITMDENQATLRLEFTNDCRKLTDCLNKISECETEDIFDLNTVFNIIEDAAIPKPKARELAPSYVLRTIIFYGRSYTIPEPTMSQKIEDFFKNPYSFCDVLMTHEPVEASNHCQKIFDILQNLDQKGISYFFPVCRDLRRMHRCTGKLLAHPLQRPIQKLIKN